MMKFLMVCAVSSTALLGGCASTGGVPPNPQVVAIVAEVQYYTKAACGFIPTAATIASILSGGNAGVATAVSVAQAICNAVNPVTVMAAGKVSAARTVNGWRVTPGKVNGVTVRGRKG